jgi:hypothetical protein
MKNIFTRFALGVIEISIVFGNLLKYFFEKVIKKTVICDESLLGQSLRD